MSSIRFTSFGAATVPLSKIIVDKDLDLRPHGVIARYCRAPVDPTVWPTETLDWGDLPEQTVFTVDTDIDVAAAQIQVAAFTAPNKSVLWQMVFDTYIQYGQHLQLTFNVTVNGDTFDTFQTNNAAGTEKTYLKTYIIPANASVVVTTHGQSGFTGRVKAGSYIKRIGTVMEDTTFNLTNKWLALGIDMHGLNATVKINGVDMPYSDYAKYFPLAPSELTISGVWDVSQTRPIVEVYK